MNPRYCTQLLMLHKGVAWRNSPSLFMTKPLSTLLGDTWAFVQSHIMTILVGAVIFGLVQGAVQTQVQTKATEKAGQFMGMDMQKFQELSQRMAQGDQEAAKELEAMGEERMNELGGTPEAREAAMMSMGMEALGGFLPTFGVGMLILMLIHMLSASYYSVIAVRGVKDVGAVFQQAFPLILPLVGLWIWTALRSFIWIPVIGFIFAIILGPRFIASPLLLIRDSKGVMDAASESYKRTNGFWGKIFGNMFVVAFATAIIGMIIGKLLYPFGGLGMWVLLVIQQVFVAFMMVFAIELSKTVLEQPKLCKSS